MGKLLCGCGNILSDVCGNDGEAFTEDMHKQIYKEGFDYEEDIYILGDGRSIIECVECGAIAIEDPIGTAHVKWYIPENRKFNQLFRKK
jgi:hypothetical protein